MAALEQKAQSRACQIAFVLMVHTKDFALEMMTKMRDPNKEYEIGRQFLEEWKPAHRGRCRVMMTQIPHLRCERGSR